MCPCTIEADYGILEADCGILEVYCGILEVYYASTHDVFAVWGVPADARGGGTVSPGGGERVEVTAEGQREGAPLFL